MLRFVLIYGVVVFGGFNIAFETIVHGPPADRAVFVATKLVLGACWGVMMWFVLRWLNKSRKSI